MLIICHSTQLRHFGIFSLFLFDLEITAEILTPLGTLSTLIISQYN